MPYDYRQAYDDYKQKTTPSLNLKISESGFKPMLQKLISTATEAYETLSDTGKMAHSLAIPHLQACIDEDWTMSDTNPFVLTVMMIFDWAYNPTLKNVLNVYGGQAVQARPGQGLIQIQGNPTFNF